MIRSGTKRYAQQHSRLKGKSNLKGFWNHRVLFRRILTRWNFCDRGLPLDATLSFICMTNNTLHCKSVETMIINLVI